MQGVQLLLVTAGCLCKYCRPIKKPCSGGSRRLLRRRLTRWREPYLLRFLSSRHLLRSQNGWLLGKAHLDTGPTKFESPQMLTKITAKDKETDAGQ